MKLPTLQIGALRPSIPLIQGGMAVRISTAGLAAAVANEGGIGIIAGTGMTVEELKNEIRRARQLTKGIIGVNVMYAVSAFAELVKTAIEEKIDLIVSGAGFSRDMFSWGKAANIPVVPIVSTGKLARISEMLGAAAVVVEGSEAGGHLGTTESIKKLVPEVKDSVSIPVIAAGGITDNSDVEEIFRLGADGVQVGVRFAASKESNAADNLKEAYVNACDEDIILIDSPVGLLGRTIRNEFSEKLLRNEVPLSANCMQCLKKCKKNFCIIKALENAQQGNLKEGLIFSGEHIGKIKEILPVKEIIRSLLQTFERNED